jgi:urate oxidase
MLLASLQRMGAAAVGVVAVRLPATQQVSSAEERKNQQRSVSFPLADHWYGKLRVRVLKVRRETAVKHSVSEYTVHTKLFSDAYGRCFTDEDNTGVVATDTQKNNVYIVAKRTNASTPEQFGVDIARQFLNEYPILDAVEIEVKEHPWERAVTEGSPHCHGFGRGSNGHAAATVRMTRSTRSEPEIRSGIHGMVVLKTTKSSWANYLHERYTTLPDSHDRCMSTELTCDWSYVPTAGGVAPDYGAIRKKLQEQITLGVFGPPKNGVHSPSVQATVYDVGCMILDKVEEVSEVTLNTPNLHYIPAMVLNQVGEKFENDIFIPTNEPSGNIQCTVSRDSARPAAQPDIDAVKTDIKAALVNMKANACPMAMRVSWHASGTYDKNGQTGGSDGATMRFEPEFSDGANKGLTMMIDMLKPVKDKNPDVSIADIWTLAGASAVEFLGGPKIPFAFGRKDASGTEAGIPSMIIPENGRLPDASQGAQHLREVFGRQGFTDRDIVALSGGHTLGRCHKVRSGFDGPWTHDPLKFDNSYFKNLMNLDWRKRNWDGNEQFEDVATGRLMMLPTDMALKTDPVFSPIAREYADDQDAFFRDFATAFSKLLHNGCPNKPQPNSSGGGCPRSASVAAAPPPNVDKKQAGLEFREYAMHGSTQRLKPYRWIADVHEKEEKSGRTALHKASFWGHIETITYLLDECKMDPNVQDASGDTALHDAVRFGHTPLVDKLLSAGTDKRIKNNEKKDAVALAIEYDKRDIARRLEWAR